MPTNEKLRYGMAQQEKFSTETSLTAEVKAVHSSFTQKTTYIASQAMTGIQLQPDT